MSYNIIVMRKNSTVANKLSWMPEWISTLCWAKHGKYRRYAYKLQNIFLHKHENLKFGSCVIPCFMKVVVEEVAILQALDQRYHWLATLLTYRTLETSPGTWMILLLRDNRNCPAFRWWYLLIVVLSCVDHGARWRRLCHLVPRLDWLHSLSGLQEQK